MTNRALTRKSDSLVLAKPGPLSSHPAAMYLASLRPGSRRTMRAGLDAVAALVTQGRAKALDLNWAGLRFQHTNAVRAQLIERYSIASVNRILSAVRGVLKCAWLAGQMTSEDYGRARAVEGLSGETEPAGRALGTGEISALLGACAADPTPAGARDAAMIALLRAGGLRRAELCALDLADYAPDDGALKVRGKGGKERMAYITSGASDAVADWLAARGAEKGPLFVAVNKGGRVALRRLTPESVYKMLAKRARQAGVKDLTPHDLRRTFVSDLLDAGADISTVQKLAGHTSVTTTQRYDRRGEEAKRKAVALLHVPYTRRNHPAPRSG